MDEILKIRLRKLIFTETEFLEICCRKMDEIKDIGTDPNSNFSQKHWDLLIEIRKTLKSVKKKFEELEEIA